MLSRIIILAHNSNIFLQHELDALAERFDEVCVLEWETTGPELKMPANAWSLGELKNRPVHWREHIKLAFSFKFMRQLLAVGLPELVGKWRFQFWHNCAVGARIASHPVLREAVAAPDRVVTIYSFWGSGPAFCLPWLPSYSGGLAIRLHSIDLYEWANDYLPMRRWLYRTADCLFFVSQHGRDYLLERYPDLRLSQKSQVVRLGSADRGLGPVPPEGSVPLIVTCSSVSPVKRLSFLAQALGQLDATRTFRWTHFGTGPLEVEVAAIAGTHAQVEVDFRGYTSNDEVLQFYSENPVDVFVNVSSREGLPISVCEALSFGIPVVATAVGGTPELVREEYRSGILIAPEATTDELATAIETIIDARRNDLDPRQAWRNVGDAVANAEQAALLLLALNGKSCPVGG